MYSINIKKVIPLHSKNSCGLIKNTDISQSTMENNNWSLSTSTHGDKIIVTQFDNCSASPSPTNFSYIKDANGTCTGEIFLKGGYTYTITFWVTAQWYYFSNGDIGSFNKKPDLYIYFSKDPNQGATSQGHESGNCGSGCIVSSSFTINNLAADNNTLHFKVKNNLSVDKGDSVEFDGTFTISAVPAS